MYIIHVYALWIQLTSLVFTPLGVNIAMKCTQKSPTVCNTIFFVLLLLFLKEIPQLNLRLFEDIKLLQCYTQLSASPSTSTTTPLTLKTCWKYSNGQHFNSDDILLTDTSPCCSRSHCSRYQPCSHLFQPEHQTWCQKQYHLYNSLWKYSVLWCSIQFNKHTWVSHNSISYINVIPDPLQSTMIFACKLVKPYIKSHST